MRAGEPDARKRLYDAYVSTHLTYRVGDGPDPPVDERRGRVFEKLYGSALPTDRDARVLDLGCGNGAFLSYLHATGYLYAEGVDSSPEQVNLARAAGLPVKEGDIFEVLAAADKDFDLITAIDLLEHLNLDEVLDLVDSAYRALKPNGVFLFQSANAEGPFGSRYRYSDLTHLTAFTARSASQLLRIMGLADIHVAPVRPVVVGLTSATRYIVWRLGEAVFRILLAAETGERKGIVLTQNLIASGRKPVDG